jgi:hypothetical protein
MAPTALLGVHDCVLTARGMLWFLFQHAGGGVLEVLLVHYAGLRRACERVDSSTDALKDFVSAFDSA